MTTLRRSQIEPVLLLVLVTAVCSPFASGKVIYVDDDAGGANDGTSWANAYVYLQDALADTNEAAEPVEIRVAQGTYKPDHGDGYVVGDQEATFVLESGVTLRGGFAGVGADDPDAWDPPIYKTVLSGDLGDNDNRYLSNFTENSHHVIWCVGADATAVLDGFTITGGYAEDHIGGGMYNFEADPTVRNCVFFDNYASQGGGMSNRYSSPTVTECTFTGNLAAHGGGGMDNRVQSHPIVDSCVFHDNRTSILHGGGLYCWDGNPVVSNCLFIDNSASFGGGICTDDTQMAIINCTFSNNHASGWGGAIHNEPGGEPIVTNCILWGNTPREISTMSNWGMQGPVVTYSDVQGGHPGEGNIDVDPWFADPDAGDYHVKSQGGRWDPINGSWVIDYVTSPCIDAGDPNSPVGLESSPHGERVNMGCYGGTVEASKSPSGELPTRYSGGSGEPNDPYQIATTEDLMLLAEIPEDYDKHFVLTADIDLAPGLPGRKVFDKAPIAPDVDPGQSRFQGRPFTGVFDGNGYVVSHLTVNGVGYLGLFGQLGPDAMVFDLALRAVDVNGVDDYVGGLAGENDGSIAACCSTGTVNGDQRVGGLVGSNDGIITSSYSVATVGGNGYVGGLVGGNGWDATVTMSYCAGMVIGAGWSVGGLIGSGSSNDTVTTCFWDTQNSGQTESAGGTGLTTAQMQTASTYEEAGWACNPVWMINEGQDYPRLFWEDRPGQPIDAPLSQFLEGEGTEGAPYLIYTVQDAAIMANFACEWDKQFKMMFLAGEGTGESPYQINTAEDIAILNVAPHREDTSFRLTFVAGEGTSESPYVIDSIEQMDLLWICPYEREAHYRLGFVSGEGTPESPYLIYSTDELGLMGQSPHELDKHFKLTADIDMSGIVWPGPIIPIFPGTFDGNDHTISHLTIDGEGSMGLFDQLGEGALVKNLGLIDVNLVASYGGALAQSCRSSDIVNCYSTGTVTGGRNIGGLVGYHYGRRDQGITGCHSTCTVVSTSDFLCNAGGLVGENSGYMRECSSAGTVTGHEYIGGLVGRNFHGGNIGMSYSTATVEATGSYVGGLVGDNWSGSIAMCYSSGPVSGYGNVGGLLGANRWNGYVAMSFSTSTVSGRSAVGGLVGENKPDSSISMSYSTGTVTGTSWPVGGLVGEGWGGEKVTASFWDTQTSSQSDSAGGTGLTTAEMQTSVPFLAAGWDFVEETDNGTDDIWWILEGQSYPGFWWDRYRTLTVSSSEHGYVVEPGEDSFTYDRGTAVSIQATADEGYLFVHWTGSAAGAGAVEDPYAANTSVTLDADYTLKAVFGPPRTVTLSADPHGSITMPGEGSFVYGEGRVLMLKAVPDPDYRFLRWAGTAIEAGRVTDPLKAETEVRIDADLTVQAVFAPFSPLYVDSRAAGTNDGTSWANAYETLQDALGVALPGCEIWVAQGVYRPDRGAGQVRGDRTAAFHLRDGVTIRGGYAGLGTPDPDAWNIEAFPTILSGDLGADDGSGQVKPRLRMAALLHAENSYHVIVGDVSGNDAVLEGLTITGGNADGNDLDCKGGGMYLYRSSPTLLSCTFTGNSGGYTIITGPHTRRICGGGGGLCNEHSNPILVDCVFYQNSTGAWGGGMLNGEQSNPRLTNCSFVENFSEDAGAGVYNLKSSPALTDCTFSENSAGDGAGMFNRDSSPTLVGCTFSANTADKTAAAMHNQGGNPLLIGCQFSHNQGQYNGGAMFNSSSNPTMVNCVFHHNTTPAFGGAISNDNGSPEIINCTFSGNESSHGGAIYTNSPMKILNSILWRDTPNEIASKGTSVTVEYSNVQGGWKGQNISADPLFTNMVQGDCHLKAGSPCTNRGNNAALPNDATDLDDDSDTRESIPWDFDANPRISGGLVDMGAYELPSTPGR